MEEYQKEYQKFCKKHGYHKEYSYLKNGITYKEISFEDNTVWYEVYGKEIEKVNVEVKGIIVEVEVELFKLEYWNTDNSISKIALDRF